MYLEFFDSLTGLKSMGPCIEVRSPKQEELAEGSIWLYR